VVVDGEKYALQLVPSGILYPHVTPVIGNGVVVDMPTLFNEVDMLESRGNSCSDLKVSTRAHLIFPWHQSHDAISEAMRGDDKLGTTLRGIGPAYADKMRRVGIRAGDARDPERFARLIRERATVENKLIGEAGGDELDVEEMVELFSTYGARLVPYLSDTISLLHNALAEDAHILLEGAQATFLDLDHGTYPYVTSSNPTAGGASVGSGLGPRDLSRIVGITKAYTTRVGAGPFVTELFDDDGKMLAEVGHEFGTVTGRARRCGWLDCVMLRHAVRLNSLTELSLTKLDILDGFDTVKICTGYTLDGEPVTDYPDQYDVLERIEPVYEELPGWKTPISEMREPGDLPAEAKAFIAVVERQVGIRVNVVGVGAERDDYLIWETS
jgi:adenylosuccinate synthase